MLWTGSNLSISNDTRTCKWAAKSWGAKETKSSHFLSPHLAPASCFACRSRVTSPDIYSLNGELARRLLRFSLLWDGCIVIIMAHAVNSKRTHTPKGICQVLTSPITLDIWTKADKIAQLSQAKPSIPITFARFVSNDRKNRSFSRQKLTFFQVEKNPLCCLKKLKMLRHNFA